MEAFEKSIPLYPNYGLYWSNKGDALNKLGRTIDANEAYAKAKKLGFMG